MASFKCDLCKGDFPEDKRRIRGVCAFVNQVPSSYHYHAALCHDCWMCFDLDKIQDYELLPTVQPGILGLHSIIVFPDEFYERAIQNGRPSPYGGHPNGEEEPWCNCDKCRGKITTKEARTRIIKIMLSAGGSRYFKTRVCSGCAKDLYFDKPIEEKVIIFQAEKKSGWFTYGYFERVKTYGKTTIQGYN